MPKMLVRLTSLTSAASLQPMYPILFKIPGIDLPIYSYGVMLGLSLVVGWYLVMYLGKKDGLPVDKLANCYLWTAVSAIVGSRILYIITNLDDFHDASLLDMVNVRKGGLVAYGGFLGGFVGAWVYLKMQRIRLLPWADIVVPTLGSGLGITRIGCFLYGCDYGKPIPDDASGFIKAIGLTFPNWKIRFPEVTEQFQNGTGCMSNPFHGSPAFHHHVSMSLVNAQDVASALVYPTQLMEVANGWIAFGLAMLVRSKTRFRGQAFLFFTAYYGVTRTLFEIIRGDTQRGGIGIFSTSQIIGITTFVGSAIAWYILSKRAAADPVAAMALGPGAKLSDEDKSTPNSSPSTRIKRRKKK
ncbi:MAG: prolipoprotein diacylglyceryl transferase [Proteobacteria bacterium]|nr:prolipoprotein diacylglyceryl transferase [Pseudomonadota bacterium]